MSDIYRAKKDDVFMYVECPDRSYRDSTHGLRSTTETVNKLCKEEGWQIFSIEKGYIFLTRPETTALQERVAEVEKQLSQIYNQFGDVIEEFMKQWATPTVHIEMPTDDLLGRE